MGEKRKKAFPVLIGTKLALLITIVILVTSITIGFISLRSAEAALEDRILSSLDALATSKEQEIVSLVDQDFERVSLVASRTKLRENLVVIEEGNPESEELAEKMNQILDDAKLSVEAIKVISATDLNGRIVASTDRNLIGMNMADSQLYMQGKEDFFLGPLETLDDGLEYTVSSPMVHPKSDNPIGVIMVRIELGRMENILSDYTGLGETGEFILGKRGKDEVIIIGPRRHHTPKDTLRIAFDSDSFEPLRLAMTKEEGIIVGKDHRDVEVLASYRYIPIGDWGIVAKIDTWEAFQPMKDLQQKVILTSLLLGITGLISALLISRIFSSPIMALRDAASKIAHGQLGHRVYAEGQDEIAQLGRSFNRMANRLEEDIIMLKKAEESQKSYSKELEDANMLKDIFGDIIRHDLQVPLNIAMGFTELIKEDEKNPEKLKNLLKIENNLERVVNIIERARILARLDSIYHLETEQLDFDSILKEIILMEENISRAKNVSIRYDSKGSFPIMANKIIEQVFSNIISNAIKFSPANKEIRVELTENEESVSVRIIDQGIGIPDKYKENIFSRFERIDKEGVEGSGLGLAIAKKIMELHKGKIGVEDNTIEYCDEKGRTQRKVQGAVFVVELPKS